MGYIDVAGVSHTLLDGRVLFREVSFRVGEGAKVALIGANGTGKTTLMRMIAGDLEPQEGAIARSGGLGVMRQLVGMREGEMPLSQLALSLAPPRLRSFGAALAAAERQLAAAETRGKFSTSSQKAQVAFAEAITAWGDAGGYEFEVLCDTVSVLIMGLPWEETRDRPLRTLSGGEQKRFALELLMRGPDEVLLLDEPDNFLDVPAKRELEERINESDKSILFVSHDREVLANTAKRIVTLESGDVWIHGGGFGTWHEARVARHERFEELRRRWDEEHQKLKDLVLMYRQKAKYNSDMASRLRAAETRLAKFEAIGPPPMPPKDQAIKMKLRGGRTGKRAIMCEQLELENLTFPFDLEVWYGDRVAILGANGTGKSHFLRLLAQADGTGLGQQAKEANGRSLRLPAGSGTEGVAQADGTGLGRQAKEADGRSLRLPAGGGTEGVAQAESMGLEPVAHTGKARLGARVRPGHFSQTHDRPELVNRTLRQILSEGDDDRDAMDRSVAMSALSRYELTAQSEQSFGTLSGGQQARFMVLLLELSGATCLLLDEPTDNLDLASAEALEQGLAGFEGTVLAVTHDRWFTRGFDRFVLFGGDGEVTETDGPVWDVR